MNSHECFPVVVEDDEDFGLLVRRVLRKAAVPDRNIRWYRDGESALAALKGGGSAVPSAVFLDLDLPGMSGLSLLERVRGLPDLVHVPVFVITGREDPERVAAAYALRARGYWLKPPDLKALEGIVRAALGASRGGGPLRIPGCLPDPRS